MSTAASALPAFLRNFDLPEPGELRRVARVYVWGRWFVLSIATFAWLYPLNVGEVVYAPNVALAMLLLATNGYLHYRLATERTVSWRWMLALSALDLAMLSGGVAAHRGFESPFFVGYYPSLALFAVPVDRGTVGAMYYSCTDELASPSSASIDSSAFLKKSSTAWPSW